MRGFFVFVTLSFALSGCATSAMLDSAPSSCGSDCLGERLAIGAAIDGGLLAVAGLVGLATAVATDEPPKPEPRRYEQRPTPRRRAPGAAYPAWP